MKKIIIITIFILAGLFLAKDAKAAVTWITPVDVTPTIGSGSGWVDADVSASVPAGATGVILHFYSTGWILGLRKNGSTDNRIQNANHGWAAIGVDTNRIFEAYVYAAPNNRITVYLVGYYTSDASFFTNAVDKSLGSTGAWTDIDISADTGADTAIGAIFEMDGATTAGNLRKNGSTDDREATYVTSFKWPVVGVDGSEILEGFIGSLSTKFYLVGYIKSDATFLTNATDISLGGTGAWTDLTALPTGATGGFIEVDEPGYGYSYGLRENGSSEDLYQTAQYSAWGMVKCDASRIIEGKINDLSMKFWLTGYTTDGSSPPPANANVFYSAGQNMDDHKTGSPTISISSGVATFSVAQTAANMGVGDKITYGGSVAYISAKQSTTIWNVITALGGNPPATTTAPVTFIAHTFFSLQSAISNATTTPYLNTTDLTSGTGHVLNIPCYYDSGPDGTAVLVNGYTTGASNYIKIYTPNNTSTEVNQSQRHSGKWNTGKYRLEVTDVPAAINMNVANVIIDGLQILMKDPTQTTRGIWIAGGITKNNIIRGANNSGYLFRGIDFYTGTNYSFNNIIYNLGNFGSSAGIFGYGGTNYVYSTTVIGDSNTYGIFNPSATMTTKNTYAYASAGYAYYGTITKTTSASSDTTGSAGLQNIAVNTTNFTNVTGGTEDFHLPLGSALIDVGTNTSGDSAPLNFTTDIDGDYRPQGSAWDIGADEYTAILFDCGWELGTGRLNTDGAPESAWGGEEYRGYIFMFKDTSSAMWGTNSIRIYDATQIYYPVWVAKAYDPERYTNWGLRFGFKVAAESLSNGQQLNIFATLGGGGATLITVYLAQANDALSIKIYAMDNGWNQRLLVTAPISLNTKYQVLMKWTGAVAGGAAGAVYAENGTTLIASGTLDGAYTTFDGSQLSQWYCGFTDNPWAAYDVYYDIVQVIDIYAYPETIKTGGAEPGVTSNLTAPIIFKPKIIFKPGVIFK